MEVDIFNSIDKELKSYLPTQNVNTIGILSRIDGVMYPSTDNPNNVSKQKSSIVVNDKYTINWGHYIRSSKINITKKGTDSNTTRFEETLTVDLYVYHKNFINTNGKKLTQLEVYNMFVSILVGINELYIDTTRFETDLVYKTLFGKETNTRILDGLFVITYNLVNKSASVCLEKCFPDVCIC